MLISREMSSLFLKQEGCLSVDYLPSRLVTLSNQQPATGYQLNAFTFELSALSYKPPSSVLPPSKAGRVPSDLAGLLTGEDP